MQVLNLSVNAVGDRAGMAFYEVLSLTGEYGLANGTLRSLDLTGNYNVTQKESGTHLFTLHILSGSLTFISHHFSPLSLFGRLVSSFRKRKKFDDGTGPKSLLF